MVKVDRHSDEFKKELRRSKKEIEKYCSQRTGFFIKLFVIEDSQLGFCYKANVSLSEIDNEYSSWVLTSYKKSEIIKEVKAKILRVDLKNIKNGGSTVVKRVVQSTPVKLICVSCGRERSASNFTRNIHSKYYKKLGGYCPSCRECNTERFLEIYRQKNVYVALISFLVIVDRPFYRELANKVIAEVKIPADIPARYNQLLNVAGNKVDATFVDSDNFDEEILTKFRQEKK
jgi:hypothetical protein